ncbi:TetR family transcriptional regulator C-terminal domain-containing protein [Actinocatenispora sera]|uniref:TetR/AcrR family transcriptional regulator n=1 Tax=Actinocatenispora sera TaxID=390989 RepID=UPI0033E5FF27
MSSSFAAAAGEPESTAGSPLTRKGQATRARIVSAAAELIFQRGVASTSIDDVRREARVSGSQMAHYFRDKRSLVRAVIEYQRDVVVGLATQPRLGRLDTFESLRLWADLNVEKVLDQDLIGGCSFGSLAGELAESDSTMRSDLASGYDQWAGVIRAGLTAMRRRGELRADARPDTLTSVLLAAHQGGSLLSQIKRDVKPLRDALNAALAYVHSFAPEDVALPSPRRLRPGAAQGRSLQRSTWPAAQPS